MLLLFTIARVIDAVGIAQTSTNVDIGKGETRAPTLACLQPVYTCVSVPCLPPVFETATANMLDSFSDVSMCECVGHARAHVGAHPLHRAHGIVHLPVCSLTLPWRFSNRCAVHSLVALNGVAPSTLNAYQHQHQQSAAV